MQATRPAPYAAFVIVAEFDIKTGGAIAHQHPHATGMNEQSVPFRILPSHLLSNLSAECLQT